MGSRVVLAMSGGVDSSVAAHLLKEQGHEVIGLFMRTGVSTADGEGRTKTCCSATDAQDAQRVADRLDIPFYALDFERDFGRIIDQFVDEYAAGRTPNPCVLCNTWLKFGKLWSYGRQVGADFVATGHYARILPGPDGHPRIARAIDLNKDQSYVLFDLKRSLLPHVRFPVGEYPKAQIRAIARAAGLPVHDKPDSQEICFVPGNNYLELVHAKRPGLDSAGAIVDENGTQLGQHQGIEGFTIGQRKGLGIALGTPRYVVEIEPASHTVTIGPRSALDRAGLEASRFNWQGPVPDAPIRCQAQIRARHQAVNATVELLSGNGVRVWFDTPQPAVTPGQVVTVYQDGLVMGGGWIDRGLKDRENAPAANCMTAS
ncbi:MAG TPA: tRNA 2-thiouridine(34) synthase MnmA [Isosphaeraceae bacterium]|jgi:tRNA-specific 2-thiouridylase|nr:tRNA 2-thiouridine(34) synthase MnmA [Isosphaeraceae bacterium]